MNRHKIIHIILVVLFALFSIVQYNDPDPLLWILIYGSVPIVAGLKLYLKQLNLRPLITTLMVILGAYALFYIPGFMEYLQRPEKHELFGSMIYNKPWVEETREFLGLLMAIAALWYLRQSKVVRR